MNPVFQAASQAHMKIINDFVVKKKTCLFLEVVS